MEEVKTTYKEGDESKGKAKFYFEGLDLYDKLVPKEGSCKTIEGELLRAVSRIKYRWFNDGDVLLDICLDCFEFTNSEGFSERITNLPELLCYLDSALRNSNDDSRINTITMEYKDKRGCGDHSLGSCANYIYKHIPDTSDILFEMLEFGYEHGFGDLYSNEKAKDRYSNLIWKLLDMVVEYILSKNGNYTKLDNDMYKEPQRHKYEC